MAEDLAEPVTPLRQHQSLREALRAMNPNGLDAIPVVSDEGAAPILVGILTRAGVLEACERALAHAV